MPRRLSFLIFFCTMSAALLTLVGSLYATRTGVERTVVGQDDYSRTNKNWQWVHFDGADFSFQDDINKADEVRFRGRIWRGGAGSDQWRVDYTGDIGIVVDHVEIFSDASDTPKSQTIDIAWQDDWLDLEVVFRPRLDSQHPHMAIYQRAGWGGWELLPSHDLYMTDGEVVRELYREFAPFTRAGALILLATATLCSIGLMWQHLSWRDLLFIGGVVGAALLLRFIALNDRAANDTHFYWPVSGSDNYVRMARETLADESHVVGAFFTPGNTIWLTALQWLLGPHLTTLYVVNTILGALSVGFVVGAGWMAVGRAVGLFGGLIAAFFPFLIFYQTTLQIAAPLSVMVAAVVFAGVWAIKRPSAFVLIIFGLLLGLTALLRPTAAFVGIAYFLALVGSRLNLKTVFHRTVLAAGFAVLVLVPLILANVTQDTGVLLNDNGPDTLYWGINRDSNGADHRGQAWFVVAERGQTYGEAAIQDIQDNPTRAFELVLHKWGLLWGNFDIGNNVDFYEQGRAASPLLKWLSIGHVFGTKTLLVLGIAGLLYRRHDRATDNFLLMALILVTLATIVFTVFGRMRVQIWPILAIAAAVPILAVWKDGLTRRLFLSGVVGLIAVFITTGFALYLPRKAFHLGDLPPSAIQREHDFGEVRLLGYDPIEMNRSPGGYVYLTLYWEKIAESAVDRGFFAHFVDPNTGELLYAADIPVGSVTYPVVRTSAWDVGTRLKESYFVPIPEDIPQVVALYIGLFDAGSVELVRIGLIDTGPLPTIDLHLSPVDWRLGESIQVTGYNVNQTDETLQISTRWLATKTVHKNYTLFYHLTDEAGSIVAQLDTPILTEQWTTSALIPDHTIEGIYTLTLPEDLPAGGYILNMGLYDPYTLDRLGIVEVETIVVTGRDNPET